MKRITWILILLMTTSFSGRLVLSTHATPTDCCNKSEKNISSKQTEEEALGTMMLLPISYNMNLISADK